MARLHVVTRFSQAPRRCLAQASPAVVVVVVVVVDVVVGDVVVGDVVVVDVVVRLMAARVFVDCFCNLLERRGLILDLAQGSPAVIFHRVRQTVVH